MTDEEFLALPEEEQDEIVREFWRTQNVVDQKTLREAGEFINSIVRPN